MEDEVQSFVNQITQSYKTKIEEVLSNCDSVIERKLIMYLLRKLLDWKEVKVGFLQFEIDDEFTNVRSDLYKYSDNQIDSFLNCRFRFSAFAVVKDFWIPIEEPMYQDHIILEPQYLVPYEKDDVIGVGKYYLLDIALIVRRKFDNGKSVILHKICIECDGHEYHSSPEQKESDNIRSRKLTSLGWTVLRYSGREIYKINKESGEELWEEIESIISSSG